VAIQPEVLTVADVFRGHVLRWLGGERLASQSSRETIKTSGTDNTSRD
jgi:hypothetical protein